MAWTDSRQLSPLFWMVILIDFFNSACRTLDSWDVDPMGVVVSRVIVLLGRWVSFYT